jgi:hypothetical protein
MAMALAACGNSPSGRTKSVGANEEWLVGETVSLSELALAEGCVVTAVDGHSPTMTVNGVETDIKPGTYSGEVVLTPTENILVEYKDMGLDEKYFYRTAVYVKDGELVPEKSVLAAVAEGDVTGSAATGIKITSIGENFNGIIVTGDSKYDIVNPKINFVGNGGNDFAGFGAAILTEGNSDVTIENADITTTGVVRTALFVGGNSTATINNSRIEVNDGTFPEGYVDRYKGGEGVMMEVPWIMGITGNCRATNVVGNGTVYYNNTHIKAQAWGALSTDAVKDVKLYATNCTIETVESGYGAYADGNSVDTFSGCTFNVPDYGAIMTQGSVVFTDGTVVNSGRFGVLAHLGRGGNTLTIEKGSVFNTQKAVIQLKASEPALNPNIVVENAVLNSENGIILQSIATDNPKHRGSSGTSQPGGSGAPMGGNMEGGPPTGGGSGATPSGGMPPQGGTPPGGGMPTGASGAGTDVNAVFRDMTLSGDIINGNTPGSHMFVTFENVAMTGAVTTATTESPLNADGEELTMEDWDLYSLVGEVAHTYGARPDDPNGLSVSLDNASTWTVDKNAYLTELTLADGASVTAPEGHALAMTVDGVETSIQPGTYKGNIVLGVK